MNPFYKVFLQPDFKDGHIITWELDPTFSDIMPWTFTLEASETPTFDELFFTKTEEDVVLIRDTSNRKQNWDYAWYYRVKLDTGDGNTYTSSTIMLGGNSIENTKYRLSAEIIRKELLLMRKFTGKQVFALKRKIYSQKVAAMIHPISGVPLGDTTSEYGTGLTGGYHKPISMFAQVVQSQNAKKLDPAGDGVKETQVKALRMIGFPLISPRDVIVFPQTDTRYMIQGTPRYVFFPGTEVCIVQEHTGMLLPQSDTVYQIDVGTT